MFDFLNDLDPLLKGFWYVALISSLIFIIQSILTILGGAADTADGIDADFDGNLDSVEAPFQFFSFRNLINFMLGFGWTGIVFYYKIENNVLLIALATVVGLIFIYLFFVLMRQILKLSEDNTFDINELVGKTGQVYIPIPHKMSGKGKIQISTRGSNHELDAMTDEEHKLNVGEVVVVEKINESVLVVKKIS